MSFHYPEFKSKKELTLEKATPLGFGEDIRELNREGTHLESQISIDFPQQTSLKEKPSFDQTIPHPRSTASRL